MDLVALKMASVIEYLEVLLTNANAVKSGGSENTCDAAVLYAAFFVQRIVTFRAAHS